MFRPFQVSSSLTTLKTMAAQAVATAGVENSSTVATPFSSIPNRGKVMTYSKFWFACTQNLVTCCKSVNAFKTTTSCVRTVCPKFGTTCSQPL